MAKVYRAGGGTWTAYSLDEKIRISNERKIVQMPRKKNESWSAINQLWVSDITYWKLEKNPVYISFITDVYSHKIVGYQVADTMEAIESVRALQMAN